MASTGFQEMVDEIVSTNPGIALALVTNGTHKPPGNWPNRFSWIRLSLDAATEDTYTAFPRQTDVQPCDPGTIWPYLDHDIRYVGISFLFARSNVHDYAAVAQFIFELVKKEKPDALHKVNIQYRPLRRDPRDYDRPFTQAVTSEQIEGVAGECRVTGEFRRRT